MNVKDIFHKYGLRDSHKSGLHDDYFQKTEAKAIIHKVTNKRFVLIAAFISLFVIVVSVLFCRKTEITNNQYGPTLPGAADIYPAVMYNDNIYYWKRMAGSAYKMPQGELPQGYEYASDIEYNDTGKLTENYQFIATFTANGKLYDNKDDSSSVCICISTFWLEDSYVIFIKD